MIEEGAEINHFTGLSEQVINQLVSALELDFDHNQPANLGERFFP